MTEEQKARLIRLKEKNDAYVIEQRRKSNTMLRDCLDNLGNHWSSVTPEIQNRCVAVVESIHCRHIAEKQRIGSIDEIPISWIGDSIFIVWDEITLPVLSSTFHVARKFAQDILAVAFETWIISENMDKVVHFSHNGHIDLVCMSNNGIC